MNELQLLDLGASDVALFVIPAPIARCRPAPGYHYCMCAFVGEARLSLCRDKWPGKEGRAIIYSVDELATTLHRSEETIRLSLNPLAEKGLIVKAHQGIDKADYIYVRVP